MSSDSHDLGFRMEWRRSSYADVSIGVEMAAMADGRIRVRNGSHPNDGSLVLTRDNLLTWVKTIKSGELDDLVGINDPTLELNKRLVFLVRSVENAAGRIEFLLAQVEYLSSQNETLRVQLRNAQVEIAQLRIIKDALVAELRKPGGPNERSTGLLAKVATVLLSVVAGAAGGVAQEVAARSLDGDGSTEQTFHTNIEIDIDSVIGACENVIAVVEEPPYAG